MKAERIVDGEDYVKEGSLFCSRALTEDERERRAGR